MKIETKFDIGEMVLVKTDTQKAERMVTNIKICPNENHIYTLSIAEKISDHYEMELESSNKTNNKAGFRQ